MRLLFSGLPFFALLKTSSSKFSLTQSLSTIPILGIVGFFAFRLFTKASFRHSLKTKKPLTFVRGCVPQAGIEPALALRRTGFSYYYGFHHPLLVCSLDYAFTISCDLGAPCLVSTRSLSGFARYSHLKGFAEFTEFYIFNFSKCTQIFVLLENSV